MCIFLLLCVNLFRSLKINSDILMVLDECPKLTVDKKIISNAIDTSTHWAKRSKIAFGKSNTKALFGIVQGGIFKDLNKKIISNDDMIYTKK